MNNDKNQEEYTIYCSRCGSEMKNTQRYCMKCGNLNYDHADNESMKAYASEDITTYEVGSGKIVNQAQNTQVVAVSSNTRGSKTFCFLFNLFFYVVSVVFSFFYTNSLESISINSFLASDFSVLLIVLSLLFMYLYSIQLIFIKSNQKWWAAFVPIYNLFVMGDIVFHKKVFGLLFIVPVFGLLLFLYLLGKKFQYSGLFTALFGFLYVPMIAFGSHYYEKKVFVNNYSNNREVELDYSQRKFYISFVICGIIFGSLVLIYTNLAGIKNFGETIDNYYYVFASRQLVMRAKNKIRKKYIIDCSLSGYSDDSGIYYVYYSDLGKKFHLPFYLYRDVIEAYIKIDNTGQETKLYISMSDGKKGFEETLYEDIHVDTIKSYSKINFSINNSSDNICHFGV